MKFITGAIGATVKTVVGVPVSLAADVLTLGGVITDKKGITTYTGDMLKSINESLEEMTD